jgi:hypothetical protein
MSVRYRLPCSCGQTVLVERSQAGLSVACSCGKQLEVPTIRGLAQLDTVQSAPDQLGWTAQYGLLLIGVLIALFAAGTAGWRVVKQGPDLFSESSIDATMKEHFAQIEKMPPGDVVLLWQSLRNLPYMEDTQAKKQYYIEREANQRWSWVLAGIAAAGVLFCVIVLATGAGQPARATPVKKRRVT